MAKQSLQDLSKNIQQAFLVLKNEQEIFSFLRDLLTEDEIKEFAQRFDIAQRLTQKQSYKDIEKETGVSSTTVARVSKFLQGKWGGYKLVLSRFRKI